MSKNDGSAQGETFRVNRSHTTPGDARDKTSASIAFNGSFGMKNLTHF